MPIVSSSKFNLGLRNLAANKISYSQKYSRSSFILLYDGKNYEAYIMTILADSAYIANNPTKLGLTTYRKRDPTLTGLVLYFKPDGHYAGGYRYDNGTLVSPKTQSNTTKSNNSLKTNVATPPPTPVNDNCTDWYYDEYIDGTYFTSFYAYTTCDAATDGGGSGGAGGTSGGSGGGSGSNPAPAPVPCTSQTGGGQEVDAISHLKVNVAQPPPTPVGGGDGDGGLPSPPVPQPCPTGTVINTVGSKSPCAQANLLTNNQPFIDRMNYLQSIQNVPGETTYIMAPNGTYQQYVSTQNGGTDQNFALSSVNGSSAVLHNHGKGAGILSVFSPNDMATLHTILASGNVANPSTFTFALVNQDGQSYLLTVTDMAKFNSWANNNTTNGNPSDSFSFSYNHFISPNNTDAVNENAFVALLLNIDCGLILMKGNTINTSWSTVVENNDGSFSVIQCPLN